MAKSTVPYGWKTATLCEVGTIVSGATPDTSIAEYYGGTVPWITPADLTGYKDKYISRGNRNLTSVGYSSCSTKLLPPGSVVYSSRAPIGYIAITQNEICTNQGFKSIIPNSEILSEYLYYYLQSIKQTIVNMASGTTFKEISGSAFKTIPVLFPPKDMQQQICAKIEELFSELDKGVEVLKKVKVQLNVYRQAVLKDAFGGSLTRKYMVTHNLKPWGITTIESLLSPDRKGMSTGPFGTMLKKEDHQKDGVAVLGIENIGEGKFLDGNKIFVSPKKAEELKSFNLKSGDVIISRSGTVGELCIVPNRMEHSLLSTNLMRISLNERLILPKFFVYMFQSKGVVVDQVKDLCKGSTRMFLNQAILKQIEFPLPTIQEQQEIICEIESRLSVCEKIMQTINETLYKTDSLRQSVLKKAFEGRLVTTNM